ncbi:MAG: hypothetical protein LPK03_11285, partial [Pontibacter sp.]|nr:hypothetical protein [Pontibacter sp.]
KALNRERMANTESLLKNHTGNEQQLNQRLQELEIAYDAHVKSFLHANQLLGYAQYKQQGPAKFRFVAVSQD